MGIGASEGTVYLADYGLAIEHYPWDKYGTLDKSSHIIGTLGYASINSHLRLKQSRRDDLEAIGYVLMHFMNGKLPWDQGELCK